MNDKEIDIEKARLVRTLATIDSERKDLNERLTNGIQAADAQTIEALTQQFLNRLKVLILIKDRPYFARIDFKTKAKEESLYIGKTTVLENDDEAVVVDWRAPISTLYYEGRVGPASYTCPDGLIEGEILLKRQFEIEERELLSYNDIDITFDEEVLKPYLSVNSNTRLKNIIATIQAEQNRIIRADMLRPLIVQGVAGSGKTTVAMHRIAYLIYTYAATIKPEEFLIIAPNAIFLDYISNVLPDLGVENVRQMTFESFAQDMIGKTLKIEDSSDKLARILNKLNPEVEIAASRLKSSLAYRDAIDAYLKEMEQNVLPKEDFCAGRYILCSYDSLFAMFTISFGDYPFAKRLNAIKERLQNAVSDNAQKVIALIDRRRRNAIAQLPKELTSAEAKERKQQIYEEDEELVHDLLHGGKQILKSYLKKWKLPTALECYRSFLSDSALLSKSLAAEETVLAFLSSKAAGVAKARVEYEDLAPLIYLQYRIHGISLSIKHVIIDEAQDFSAFQFYVFKEALKCNSMTIFGDIAQGIYSYRGTNEWTEIGESIFGGKSDFTTLQKSYRSTIEIMEQANRILSQMPKFRGIDKAEPVIRHGDPVRYIGKDSDAEIMEELVERIRSLQRAGVKNIAVICKTTQGCSSLAAFLKKHALDFHLVTGKEYAGGLSVVPSYLVKGLEFDAVLIADAHLYENNDTDIKLLYVAMTRAMHSMDVYFSGPEIPLLK